MAITLRVIGIFYNTKLEIGEKATVKEVLVAAQSQISAGNSFRYTPKGVGDQESPHQFYAFYEGGVTSKSGRTYPSGGYSLSENLSANSDGQYSVWQYYITKPDGTSYNPAGGKFLNYDDPQAVVEDGGAVTWRLVNILDKPNGLSPREEMMLS